MTYPTNVYYRGESPDRSIRVRRLYLDRGGYTRDGRYFGLGAPLYEAYDAEEGRYSEEVRAWSRDDAIDQLQIPAVKLCRR